MNLEPEFLPLGPDGIIVRFATQLSEPANRAALAFRAALTDAAPAGVVETATSLTSVFLRFRPDQVARASLVGTLHEVLGDRDWSQEPLPQGRALWHLPAVFGGDDGPDLGETADAAGVSPQTAVAELCSARLRVMALGFAPGQPYLGFMPEHWNIPRRTEVTPEVPRGAIVVAVRQVIPFANAAPTGWRQVGRAHFRCYDPKINPPLPLRPGDEVCFRAVETAAFEKLRDVPFGGAEREVLA